MRRMKKCRFLPLLCLAALLGGCASPQADRPQQPDGILRIGDSIQIAPPEQLTFLEMNDALSADGMYYAAWIDGSSVPYENSEGDTVDLYDAQLHLLASESPEEGGAQEDCAAWLSAARERYEVYSEETVACGGTSYTLVTYRCTGEGTPFDRGVSAFGASGCTAVCIELVCRENYTKELRPIVTDFLEGISYCE